jgi:hypothetical protein
MLSSIYLEHQWKMENLIRVSLAFCLPGARRRAKEDGVRAFFLHPGTTITPLSKHISRLWSLKRGTVGTIHMETDEDCMILSTAIKNRGEI